MTFSAPISLSSTYFSPLLLRWHVDHIITSNCSCIISVSHSPLSNYHHPSAQLISLNIQLQQSFHHTQTNPIPFPCPLLSAQVFVSFLIQLNFFDLSFTNIIDLNSLSQITSTLCYPFLLHPRRSMTGWKHNSSLVALAPV